MAKGSVRQGDLQKAIRAARAAGFDLGEVRICDGEIRLLARGDIQGDPDVRSEIDRWQRGKD